MPSLSLYSQIESSFLESIIHMHIHFLNIRIAPSPPKKKLLATPLSGSRQNISLFARNFAQRVLRAFLKSLIWEGSFDRSDLFLYVCVALVVAVYLFLTAKAFVHPNQHRLYLLIILYPCAACKLQL